MKLSIKVKYFMVKFKHEELRDAYISSISPRINVLNLDIDTEVTRNYRHLIDGLLWSCHPETLSVQSGNQRIKKKFVKVFCHEFGNREIEKNCYRSRTKSISNGRDLLGCNIRRQGLAIQKKRRRLVHEGARIGRLQAPMIRLASAFCSILQAPMISSTSLLLGTYNFCLILRKIKMLLMVFIIIAGSFV